MFLTGDVVSYEGEDAQVKFIELTDDGAFLHLQTGETMNVVPHKQVEPVKRIPFDDLLRIIHDDSVLYFKLSDGNDLDHAEFKLIAEHLDKRLDSIRKQYPSQAGDSRVVKVENLIRQLKDKPQPGLLTAIGRITASKTKSDAPAYSPEALSLWDAIEGAKFIELMGRAINIAESGMSDDKVEGFLRVLETRAKGIADFRGGVWDTVVSRLDGVINNIKEGGIGDALGDIVKSITPE
jgi:hypothetical protein